MPDPTDQLVDTPDPTLEIQQLDHHQADLVIQGFDRLVAHSLHWPSIIPRDIPTDMTLDEISRAVDDIIPGTVPEPTQTTDRHFQEFKCYRLHGMARAIGKLEIMVSVYFLSSRSLIEGLKLQKTVRWHYIRSSAVLLNESIDETIKWMEGSEFDFIREFWPHDEMRSSLTNYYFHLSSPDSERPMSRPAEQLFRSVIPIMRLSKLFFDKLAREGMKKKLVPLFTEMSSGQLEFLDQAARFMRYGCEWLVKILKSADARSPESISSSLIDIIGDLSDRFQRYVYLAEHHIAPFIFPDINELSSQNYDKSWFATWHSLFSTASQNAIHAAYSLRRTTFLL
ncbi:hypothetical protein PtA15_14A385 [Puccinia triticina]|uniref:Uncharacterized protein n=1 Tax=Puccinia triticina TaxID=208348 RepID=A0ABY7D273_9BASI|nr:uncharacterized protein PtA15_14A385 [Puccinia triticina]WAQ91501.1 hypothetical protein PtA15_14A385 [Puccinia triticina]